MRRKSMKYKPVKKWAVIFKDNPYSNVANKGFDRYIFDTKKQCKLFIGNEEAKIIRILITPLIK